jgi:cyclophilin family peptidyl-prolyl cis-trans isomerase
MLAVGTPLDTKGTPAVHRVLRLQSGEEAWRLPAVGQSERKRESIGGGFMPKRGKRVGRSTPPRSLTEDPKDDQLWWWIGGGAAVLLIGALVVWLLIRPGEAASPTPTPSPSLAPTEPSETAAPATAAPTEESTTEEESSMPSEPANRNNMYSEPPEMQIDPGNAYQATIATEKGDIVVALDADAAPQTVNNFVFLARGGFYDGLTFHRVEPGFVIQGGDPLGSGRGGPGYTVPAEIELEHVKGAIAMARQGDQVNPERASSGSQFYITLAETPHLDGAYTVFGEVIEGMDVVESIEVGDVIESVTIEEN